MSNPLQTVPILKKDEEVLVTLNYNDLGCIAQAIFIISDKWKQYTPEKITEFKRLIDAKEPFTDLEMIDFMMLDLLYKKLILAAKEQGKTEEIDLSKAISPLEFTQGQ